jgi:hypothetical protein
LRRQSWATAHQTRRLFNRLTMRIKPAPAGLS